MPWFTSARNFAAFGLAIPNYVRQRFSLDEARALVRERLETREQRFLEMLRLCVFDNEKSPYLPLLKSVSCELEDIRRLVEKDGLEPTLLLLRQEGVYLTFEEFKGRQRVERGGVSFTARPSDFASPVAKQHDPSRTGGTTGSAVRFWKSLEFRREVETTRMLGLAAHGLLGVPTARWGGDRASSATGMVGRAPFEGVPDRWFVTRIQPGKRERLKFGLATTLIAYAARLGGAKLPKPQWIDPEDGLSVAQWARQKLESTGKCVVRTNVSRAVRLAIAASENGIDLHGASIMGGAEPPTPGKVAAITRSGVTWIPTYVFSEGGQVGMGCVHPVDGTDVHFNRDRLALVQYPRQVPSSDLVVDAFNFTSLSVHAPRVLLNVEIDDFGILERRNCGCPLEELGFHDHLREIYSFRKLTGEGVTLVGSDMVRILEDVLPSRFGGSPLDYQLVEEEDEKSLTRLYLLIHPRLGIDNEASVVEAVIDELEKSGAAAGMAGTIWARCQTLRIKRAVPVTTWRGKLMPLHLSRKAASAE